jgi:hypothetical protein
VIDSTGFSSGKHDSSASVTATKVVARITITIRVTDKVIVGNVLLSNFNVLLKLPI